MSLNWFEELYATYVTRRPAIQRSCKVSLPYNIVIQSGDLNPGLQASVYLNLTHALNRSATTAGLNCFVIDWINEMIWEIIKLVHNNIVYGLLRVLKKKQEMKE